MWWRKKQNSLYQDGTNNTWYGSFLFKYLKKRLQWRECDVNYLNTEMPFVMFFAVYLFGPLPKLQVDSIAYWWLWFDRVTYKTYVES